MLQTRMIAAIVAIAAVDQVSTGVRSVMRPKNLYKMECEPFLGAGTPSVVDRSRRVKTKAVPIPHANAA